MMRFLITLTLLFRWGIFGRQLESSFSKPLQLPLKSAYFCWCLHLWGS
jgi:hypothetical protein